MQTEELHQLQSERDEIERSMETLRAEAALLQQERDARLAENQ